MEAATESTTDAQLVGTLMAGELGDFLRLPPVRRLIAQEFAIDHFRPFVETPDLLLGEQGLLERWRKVRSDVAAEAERLARVQLLEVGFTELASGPGKDRLLLRLAACRRLDSWHTGHDKYSDRPHSMAGELNITIQVPGVERPMKIGEGGWSSYEDDPRKDREVLAFCADTKVVEEVEFALYPLSGRGGLRHARHWAEIRGRWDEAAELRRLERETARGAFPQGLVFSEPPDGIVARVDRRFIQEVGHEILAQLGLCPWWPAVTDEFFSSRQLLFPQVASVDQAKAWCARIYLRRRPGLPR